MKRLLIIILIFCLALSCAACTEDAEDQTLFYYLRTPDTIAYGEADALIAPVPRDITPDLPLDDALQLYLNGSMDETLLNPIPKGTYLLSTIERKDMLVLVLSGEFSTLDGIELTLAGACLAATCHDLTGQGRIQVRSGENIYDFDLNDFVFLDNSPGR
jgi:spore germination protein GerM